MTEVQHQYGGGRECMSLGSEDEVAMDNGVTDYHTLYHQETTRRKTILKLAQKATRDYDELKLRYVDSTQTVEALRLRLEETDHELKNLQNVSEAVYHEYDSLKTRYEVESETMAQAFSRATEWYNENKTLRRETAVLRRQSCIFIQKFTSQDQLDIGALELDSKDNSIHDEVEKQHQHEVTDLMDKIKDLEADVANLNAEQTKARNDEFEAQEEAVELRKQLDDMQEEMNSMRARHEHAVISRQSAIMVSEVSDDERVQKSLQEVNVLASKLISQAEQHGTQLQQLQHQICMYEENDSQQELSMMKEKCELLEQEALEWQRKHIKASTHIGSLEQRIENLQETLVEQSDVKQKQPTNIPIPPPPPPMMHTVPPPPPPPPPPNAVVTLAAMIGVSKKNMKSVEQNETAKAPAMNDLIDQIKRGGIQLKKTPKVTRIAPKIDWKKPTTQTPARKLIAPKCDGNAISEMKNILATMKRSRSNRLKPSSIGHESKCQLDESTDSIENTPRYTPPNTLQYTPQKMQENPQECYAEERSQTPTTSELSNSLSQETSELSNSPPPETSELSNSPPPETSELSNSPPPETSELSNSPPQETSEISNLQTPESSELSNSPTPAASDYSKPRTPETPEPPVVSSGIRTNSPGTSTMEFGLTFNAKKVKPLQIGTPGQAGNTQCQNVEQSWSEPSPTYTPSVKMKVKRLNAEPNGALFGTTYRGSSENLFKSVGLVRAKPYTAPK